MRFGFKNETQSPIDRYGNVYVSLREQWISVSGTTRVTTNFGSPIVTSISLITAMQLASFILTLNHKLLMERTER